MENAPPSPLIKVEITLTENEINIKRKELDEVIKKCQLEILEKYKQLKESDKIIETVDTNDE